MGHGRGIGPEVIVKALSLQSVRRPANILVVGDVAAISKIKKRLKNPLRLNSMDLWEVLNSEKVIYDRDAINIIDLGSANPATDPLRYLNCALMLIKERIAEALVTAPVNKEEIIRAGVKFTGHTEYIARFAGIKKVAMMFVGRRIRVTLVTRHLALREVAKNITRSNIRDAAILTNDFLKDKFKIREPRIGVCALNPHAGEGGRIGREEQSIISPAVKNLRRRVPGLWGPLPADTAFYLLSKGGVDALLCMYHDQGMIPVKMIGREACVNVTLGLGFVRTSPAHGTAYDIAGKGIADPSAMIEAIRLAARLC